jgi:hypothetical protein
MIPPRLGVAAVAVGEDEVVWVVTWVVLDVVSAEVEVTGGALVVVDEEPQPEMTREIQISAVNNKKQLAVILFTFILLIRKISDCIF